MVRLADSRMRSAPAGARSIADVTAVVMLPSRQAVHACQTRSHEGTSRRPPTEANGVLFSRSTLGDLQLCLELIPLTNPWLVTDTEVAN